MAVLLYPSVHAEKIYGIGIVTVDFDSTTVIDFYASPANSKPERTIEFFNDKSLNSWNIKELAKHTQWLSTYMNLDYSIFNFQYKRERDDWIEVVVNLETGKTLWIRKSPEIATLTWGEYITNMFGIGLLESFPQDIRQSPDNDADSVKGDFDNCFKARSMTGDWIEIFTPDYCNDLVGNKGQQLKSGWIKWREGGELIIELYPYA